MSLGSSNPASCDWELLQLSNLDQGSTVCLTELTIPHCTHNVDLTFVLTVLTYHSMALLSLDSPESISGKLP